MYIHNHTYTITTTTTATDMNDIGKENEVLPRTPRAQVKKALGAGAAGSRVRRLPLASKDSNRGTAGGAAGGNIGAKGARKGALHLKKYGSILYQGQQGLGSANDARAGVAGLPRVKSLVLKDLDSGKDTHTHSDDSDDDMGILSRLRGLSEEPGEPASHGPGLFGGQGLKALLEHDNDSSDSGSEVETAPLRQDPLPYVPDGVEPLDIEDLRRLDAAPALHLATADELSDSSDSQVQLLPLAILPTEDTHTHTHDARPTPHSHSHSARTHRPDDDDDDASLELALATPLDSQYAGLGLDADDLADLLR